MTGKEAWSIISPILAAHMVPYSEGGKHDLDLLDEAYIMTLGALLEHDKNEKNRRKNEKSRR
jgi:hypothetical protein